MDSVTAIERQLSTLSPVSGRHVSSVCSREESTRVQPADRNGPKPISASARDEDAIKAAQVIKERALREWEAASAELEVHSNTHEISRE